MIERAKGSPMKLKARSEWTRSEELAYQAGYRAGRKFVASGEVKVEYRGVVITVDSVDAAEELARKLTSSKELDACNLYVNHPASTVDHPTRERVSDRTTVE